MRLLKSITVFSLLASIANAQDWGQWGRNAQHDGASPVTGSRLQRIRHELLIDPFVQRLMTISWGSMLVHYQVPLLDGRDAVVLENGGVYTGRRNWETITWSVKALDAASGDLTTRWRVLSDWKPVPASSSVGGPG